MIYATRAYMKTLVLLCMVLVTFGCTLPKEDVPLAYRDSGGFFTKPVIGFDDTIYVGSLNKCFYAFSPDGKVKWRYPMGGSSHSDPVADSHGNLYFGSDNNYVHSIDSSGQLRWRHKVKGQVQAGAALGPNETVYFTTMKGFVHAFGRDGHEKWTLEMPKGSKFVKFTPLVMGNHIIVGSEKGTENSLGLVRIVDNGTSGQIVNSIGKGGAYRIGAVTDGLTIYTSEEGSIQAVEPDLSKILWSFPVEQVHRSHPVLSTDKRTVYQGSRDTGFLYALAAATGYKKWHADLERSLVMTPAVDPVTGVIYIGQAAGGPYFFAMNPNGTEKWRSNTGHSLRSTPALSNDRTKVYSGGNVGPFFALDTETGEQVWAVETMADSKLCNKI
jgi:outer membrane protein assembly factor BamB